MATKRRSTAKNMMQKRTAAVLISLLLAAALTAAMLASPDFTAWLFRMTGIHRAQPPAVGQSTSSVGVHVIDVGQGSAMLLEDSGEYALVDTGEPQAADELAAYLNSAGVHSLKYVFMTHPHADHIGGMAQVLTNYDTQTLVLPNFELAPMSTSQLLEDVLTAATQRNVPTETAVMGAMYPLGGGVIQVVHAGVESEDNLNLLSLGLLFESEGLSVLNTGDGEKQNERAMLASGISLAADVFIAGHHGSSTSNEEDFLRAVSPGSVVVSCGLGNDYGHPHHDALNSFDAVGALLLRTDLNGHVLLRPGDEGGVVYGVTKGE